MAVINYISIHALREEGDRYKLILSGTPVQFLSTPSARRATADKGLISMYREKFLSTPSARRATAVQHRQAAAPHYFYPRPPRGGRPDIRTELDSAGKFLSTPSARRATGAHGARSGGSTYFYPRPPRGGRQSNYSSTRQGLIISIHALREEGDVINDGYEDRLDIFLSTPSARRATLR